MRKLLMLSVVALTAACAQASRSVLRSQAAGAAGALAPVRGELLPDEQIQQVLNRLTFGARPGDAERVRSMGVEAWIDQQLHPDRIDDARTAALLTKYPVFAMATPDVIRDYNVAQQVQRQAKKLEASDSAMNNGQARREVLAADPTIAAIVRQTQQFVGQVQSAQVARAVTTDRQLDEVMVEFWENHFSVFAGKGQTRLFLPQYDRDVIRPHVLGKFRDLLGAVARSPAMLFFLDNWQSAADSTQPRLVVARGGRGTPRIGIVARRPAVGALAVGQPARAKRGLNENYARELMELHTLGVDGGYSQTDVQEVARALTGWSFNRQTGEFTFLPQVHDAGAKTILGHKFPAGRGIEEGEEVLDLIARHPATARFITAKLARHFVSDEPPRALVDRCAATFSKTDGDIRETLRCVITSPEFFSRAAYRAKVKTPFELVASALRAVNAQPDTTPRTAQIVARLGQPIFGRQTPDGWPDRGDAWMNTGAILNRINFGLSVAAGQVPGATPANWPEYAALRAESRAQQVDAVVKSMLGGQVSAETREVLMTGDNPMIARLAANDVNGSAMLDSSDVRMPAADTMRPGAAAGKGMPRGRGAQGPGIRAQVNLQGLAQVVGLALGAPEFQRR